MRLSRLGTVSATAESLRFSQSAVSHQLATLLRAIGTVLLTQAGRGVRFTEKSRTLAVRGQETLDLLERTEHEVVSVTRAEAERMHLATFPSAVASLMPGVLGVVGRQYPDLEVELVDAEPPKALEAPRRGRMDTALSFSCVDDDAGEGLQAKRLLDDVLYLVTHPDSITHIADGARYRWMAGCTRCREELLAVGRANGFTPKTAYASDDYVAVQALVAAGIGATLLPGMALSAYRHEGIQVRSLAHGQRRVEVVTHVKRPRSLAIDVLMETCRVAVRRTSLRQPVIVTGGDTTSQ